MVERILTVTQLNDYVSGIMTYDPILRHVQLQGEVSNLRQTASGHIYFVLKDERALIRCVLFKHDADGLNTALEEGMQIIAGGSVSIYVRDGQYQFYVQTIQKQGLGELYQQFEQVKAELAGLGYFDAERKRPIPVLPRKIGIVTSATGAVLHDVVQVASRRCPLIPLLFCPSAVQGDRAVDEMVQAIHLLNEQRDVDVIILARGGGSIEDLWPFNTAKLAQAIHWSKKPIISAVGHETDYTIADFTADMRAPTPSAAAELATPMMRDLWRPLQFAYQDMCRRMNAMMQARCSKQAECDRMLRQNHPGKRIPMQQYRLRTTMQRMCEFQQTRLRQNALTLAMWHEKLSANSPERILSQGYALIRSGEETIVQASQLHAGDRIEIMMQGGRVYALVLDEEK